MAGREIRASWRRLLFFFVCVAIGVGAIVALRSMIQNVRTGLAREARALIAGDVVIGTNRSWTPELRAAIEQRLAGARSLADRTRSRSRRWSGQRRAGRPPRRWSSCAACKPDFRSTAPSSSRAACRSRTTCSRITARWCGRSSWRSSVAGGRSPIVGGQSLHDSRRHLAGAGAARRRRSASDRACWSTTTI